MTRTVVDDCETVKVTDISRCVPLGFQFATVPTRQEKEAAALAAATALAADPIASVAELKRICALNPPSRKKTGVRWTLNLL